VAKACLAKKIASLTDQKASLCDQPHPPGAKLWGPRLESAGSYRPGLSAATLLDGTSPTTTTPRFEVHQRPTSMQEGKFCPKFDTVFINSDITVYKKIYLIYPRCKSLKIFAFM